MVNADAVPNPRAESERSFLERSLADLELEHDAGDLDDADYSDLKSRYEAKLLRSGAATVVPGSRSRHQNGMGWGRWVVTAVVVLVVGVGGGLAVANIAGARKPGETITGTVPTTSAQQLAEAATLAGRGQVLDALKLYDAVLAENPKDVRALTYKGWLLRNVGVQSDEPELAEEGAGYLKQATDIDPTFAEAWLFQGIIYLRDEHDPVKAAAALKLALSSNPIAEVATAARELLGEIQQSKS